MQKSFLHYPSMARLNSDGEITIYSKEEYLEGEKRSEEYRLKKEKEQQTAQINSSTNSRRSPGMVARIKNILGISRNIAERQL